MAARSKIESVDEVRRWYEAGVTYREMAEMHREKYGVDVTPGAFAALRRRMGWDPRIAVGDHPLMPWSVRDEHRSSYIYMMLRREIRRREGLPWASEKDSEDKLDQWLGGLRENGAVVDYRPDTGPGFFLTYARPGIDNDIVREPNTA